MALLLRWRRAMYCSNFCHVTANPGTVLHALVIMVSPLVRKLQLFFVVFIVKCFNDST